MAKQAFQEAIKSEQKMILFAPDKREIKGFYCDPKVDRTTLPNGWYAYDIRHDDDGCGIFVELCHDFVFVNYAGTFLTQEKIPELSADGSYISFEIDPEEWKMAHSDPDDTDSIGEIDPCPVTTADAWSYSF